MWYHNQILQYMTSYLSVWHHISMYDIILYLYDIIPHCIISHDTVWYQMTLYDSICYQCDIILYSMTSYSASMIGVTLYDIIWCQHGIMWHYIKWCHSDTKWQCMASYGTLWHHTTQYDIMWHCIISYGIILKSYSTSMKSYPCMTS